MKKTIILVFAVLVTGYFIFFFLPKIKLQLTLNIFESAARSNDINRLQNIVSTQSPIYKHLDTKMFQQLFSKFNNNIEVKNATLLGMVSGQYGKYLTISGEAQMVAIVDGEPRNFDLIYIQKEDGIWKIIGFGFPDYINY